jgi:hypothetical protein
MALGAVGRPAPDDPVANYLAHSVSRRELALVRHDLLALRGLQAEMSGLPPQSMARRHEMMQGERVSVQLATVVWWPPATPVLLAGGVK